MKMNVRYAGSGSAPWVGSINCSVEVEVSPISNIAEAKAFFRDLYAHYPKASFNVFDDEGRFVYGIDENATVEVDYTSDPNQPLISFAMPPPPWAVIGDFTTHLYARFRYREDAELALKNSPFETGAHLEYRP